MWGRLSTCGGFSTRPSGQVANRPPPTRRVPSLRHRRPGATPHARIRPRPQARRRFLSGHLRRFAELLPQARRRIESRETGPGRQDHAGPRLVDRLHLRPREPGPLDHYKDVSRRLRRGAWHHRGASPRTGARNQADHPHRWRSACHRGRQPPAHHPARLRPGHDRNPRISGHPPRTSSSSSGSPSTPTARPPSPTGIARTSARRTRSAPCPTSTRSMWGTTTTATATC